jgi:hypothetical protein
MVFPIPTSAFQDDEDDDEDSWYDEMITFLLLAFAGVYSIFFGQVLDPIQRAPPVAEQRLDWEAHRDLEVSRGLFRRLYRMELEDFELLVSLLRESLEVNEVKALNRSVAGAIIPELRLHCLIRWLAGGSYLDIVSKVNMHPSTFYPIVWSTCAAICACEQLAFCFPDSVAMAAELARGFESVSTDGVVNGCVGAIDGWLMPIIVPPGRFGNVSSYFSGHYQRYGMNVQAICDHQCRFLYIAIAAPGGQPDINAFRYVGLADLLRKLPLGFYLIGDNAYPPSEWLLPVFGGLDRLNRDNDNANYYMSQCRIRIEMTFGMMVQKWGIFQRSVRVDLENTGPLLETVARLHNFCINQRVYGPGANDDDLPPPHPQAFDEDDPRNTTGTVILPPTVPGVSRARLHFVQRVRRMGLVRPT